MSESLHSSNQDAFDVIVVGYGGSGASAAIEAHDAGGRVLVIEKAGSDDHSPTTALLAGGAMFGTDRNATAEYLKACAGAKIPPEVTDAWAAELTTLRGWMNSLAPQQFRMGASAPSAEFPDLPGAHAIESSPGEHLDASGVWSKGSGTHLFGALKRAVEDRGITVRFDTCATRLITEDDRVRGVRVQQGELEREIHAQRAVILATGGFEFDDELKRQYLVGGDDVHFYGSRHATGDGIRMAQAAGADLWHMSSMAGRGVGHFSRQDGSTVNTILLLDNEWLGGSDPVGYVITDDQGERFADELVQAKLGHSFYYEMLHYDAEKGRYPRIPSFWFFDRRRIEAGPLTIPRYGATGSSGYAWSEDNSREVDAGWIHTGRTVAEAAMAAGIADPDAVVRSVDAYNVACTAGGDPFRTLDMTPLDAPPFFCVKLFPGGTNTTGGPRRGPSGEVVHVFGHPIDGLYACGENGSIMGERYPGLYAYYAEALGSGRLAGRAAACTAAERTPPEPCNKIGS